MQMIDLTLLGASTTASGVVLATDPNQSTLILSLAIQIVSAISLLLKHRAERRQRRKLSKPNYKQ